MADTELEKLEKIVTTLATSVATLTTNITALTASVSTLTKDLLLLSKDVMLNRVDIGKLHAAVQLMNGDVEKHGHTLRRMEIEEAKESGRKEAMGDLQTKLQTHDDAARKVSHLETTLKEQHDLLEKLKSAHDHQRGVILAFALITPIVVTLLTAWLSKLLGIS